ncbi:hypothetical protein F8388_009469 [Cannabis sativa]|uniref:Uncharacterized protein n=1 Tax=Cannabis sativa TaxID=3483 RepID=A0A7J6GYA8_CANSA|nr:hypothetical protein F8388_009469 [Cannabis sativa]KAF4387109.1 hypothetical protein G4B88_024681 [Cannabis sativa]
MLLIFSPPDIITSFDRSFISIYPSEWTTPTSPVKNQPFLKANDVVFGSLKYPFIKLLPLITISPNDFPSRGMLSIVLKFFTSTWSAAGENLHRIRHFPVVFGDGRLEKNVEDNWCATHVGDFVERDVLVDFVGSCVAETDVCSSTRRHSPCESPTVAVEHG